MSLKGQYEQADEKSVGTWRNTKSATGIYTFQHAVAQWLFFSKGTEISAAKYPGWDIDGHIVNVITEKSKNTSSHHSISLVFDKRNGLDKFWSEFIFLSSYCPTEVNLMRGDNWSPNYPLSIKTEGAYSSLEVINPESGEVEYTSKKFYKKNAKKMYEEDLEFQKWFNVAIDYACSERISKGILKIDTKDRGIDVMPSNSDPDEEVIMESEEMVTPISEPVIEEEKQPKRRGRPKKEQPVVAATSNDDFLSESVILEE